MSAAKSDAAFSKVFRQRCDARLAELRKQPPLVDWQILPAEAEVSWMTKEERNIVEWFDRREYEIFADLARHHRGGWIVRFCKYVCLAKHLAEEERIGTHYWNTPMLDSVLDDIISAAESGNGRAQYSLGFLYEGGFHGRKRQLEMDVSLAWDWYKKSAENGCIQGQRAFARMLHDGPSWKQLTGMDFRELQSGEIKGTVDWDAMREKCQNLSAEYLRESLRWRQIIAERGDIKACYDLACSLVVGDEGVRDIEQSTKWLQVAAKAGFPKAVAVITAAGDDMSAARIAAELHISLLLEKSKERRDGSGDGAGLEFCDGGAEEDVKAKFGDDWLLDGKPEGTVVPPASGRETVRTPNLKSANPSFAALLIRHVRDKFGGDAPQVYRAAHVSRKTYSSIVSNELRPVSKQTAIAFALALQLPIDDANALLNAAGHALSEFLLDDIIFKACIATGIHDIDAVNQILTAHAAKPLPFCQE